MKKVFIIVNYLISIVSVLLSISMLVFDSKVLLPIGVSLMLFAICNLPVVYNRYFYKVRKKPIVEMVSLSDENTNNIRFLDNFSTGVKRILKKIVLFIMCLFFGLVANLVITLIDEGINNFTTNESTEEKTYDIKEGITFEYKDTKFYEYGDVLIEKFNLLGIKDAKKLKINKYEKSDKGDEIIEVNVDLEIETEKELIFVHLIKYQGEWDITGIKSKDKNYYIRGNYVDFEKTLVKNDIYSYTTGEIIEKKDEEKIKTYHKALEEERRDKAVANFFNMEADYLEDPIAAKEKHEGKNFIIEGTITNAQGFDYGEGLTEYNSILLDISVEHYAGSIHVACAFDYSMKEELLKYNIGDKIIIFAECVNSTFFRNCNITVY